MNVVVEKDGEDTFDLEKEEKGQKRNKGQTKNKRKKKRKGESTGFTNDITLVWTGFRSFHLQNDPNVGSVRGWGPILVHSNEAL